MKQKIINFVGLLVLLGSYSVVFAMEPLVVYSGRSDNFVKPVIDRFTEKTGIEVILHAATSTALLNKLRVEGDRTEADLFISNDSGNLQIGADLGLFKEIDSKIAALIPSSLRAPDNSWVGLSARARVLVVNTDQHKFDDIDSVFDLADPRLKGRLAITNTSNESFVAGATVYMLAAGSEQTRQWLQGMRDNTDGEAFNKHSKIVAEVAAGRKDVGLVNHYYIYRHFDKHPLAPIKIVVPDQGKGIGAAWNVAGVAISRYSDQPQQAQRLVEFLVSVEGQKIFAEVNREYPTRQGVSSAAEIPSVEQMKIADVPMAALGRNRNATLDLIEASGLP